MSSSEFMSSGKFAGGRSTFSQTCSLLSQYLKEKGSFGDLSLSLAQNLEPKGAPLGTMNLFPVMEKPGQISGCKDPNLPVNAFPYHLAGRDEAQKRTNLSGMKNAPENGQMTIFYAGQVLVFNDFPADKAKEIMMLASKSSSGATVHNHHNATSWLSTTNVIPTYGISTQTPLGSDLPIARKNSLARFLEKRKDRITANAPYQASKSKASAPKPETWLGLAPQFSLERH